MESLSQIKEVLQSYITLNHLVEKYQITKNWGVFQEKIKGLLQSQTIFDWRYSHIPKILYLYWGNTPITFMHYMTIVSFSGLNPDWYIIVFKSVIPRNCIKKEWTTNQQSTIYSGKDYFQDLKSYHSEKIIVVDFSPALLGLPENLHDVHISDILRWYLLGTFGGVWSDFDILYCKPMGKLLIENKNAHNILGHYSNKMYAVGLLLASLNSDFKVLYQKSIQKLSGPVSYQKFGTDMLYDMQSSKLFFGQNTSYVCENSVYYIAKEGISAGVARFFEKKRHYQEDDIIGFHWYHGDPIAGKYCNLIDVANYRNFDNTPADIIDMFRANLCVNFPEITDRAISIIIPTFNRPELLRWGLTSLSKQNTTYQFEVIVVDDGDDSQTQAICDHFHNAVHLTYIRLRPEISSNLMWRVPSFAINAGVRRASGRFLILACPEMYWGPTVLQDIGDVLTQKPASLVTPRLFDDTGSILAALSKDPESPVYNWLPLSETLNWRLPFLMGFARQKFLEINGYDEDFFGIGYDDNDFVDRMILSGCSYARCESKAVHLYHPRINFSNGDNMQRYHQNRVLYEQRKGKIVRNESRAWGLG
jgi:GT2 family glycosyltransferase